MYACTACGQAYETSFQLSCDLFCCCFQLSSDLLRCPAGPVSLLSGLNPRPSVLVAHFFMVAVYGIGRLLLPRPGMVKMSIRLNLCNVGGHSHWSLFKL